MTAPDTEAPAARYHHGDLRAALLDAAEVELREAGVERFSLRAVAKRAGVSHAAPAHHFRDLGGLFTALAARGFRRFLAAQGARKARAGASGRDQLAAGGLGYVDFARANPALFRLMFSSDRPDFADPELCEAAGAAYGQLEADVGAATEGEAALADVAAAWALAHGLADLLQAGRLQRLAALDPEARDRLLAEVILRALGS